MRSFKGLSMQSLIYDIPDFNVKAPLGTSLFQLWKEREFANKHEDSLNQKYDDTVAKQARKLTKEERAPEFIKEP